ncbi:MAG TPA: Na+/H+ antiporter NhaA [Rugosibacter sp.]|nr:Na+/H+ antiporter NhaA [Rugosibacter sp.]
MSAEIRQSQCEDKGVIYAPWERAFSKVLTPFEEFIHRQTTSGLLLMITACIALFLANGPFSAGYLHLIHSPLSLKIADWEISMTLHHFVNDGLMAIFFFVVGLELKREMIVGELSSLKQAALPVVAAIGGMIVPALIFLLFNHDNLHAVKGWGVPMATDIAFAVGALVLLADRVPKGLITFLVALAIADDLGAVLVIALFYTQKLSLSLLLVAALLTMTMITLNFAGIRSVIPYFMIAVLLWYALLLSGVHATLAGVIGAFCVPARSKYNPGLFTAHVREKIDEFNQQRQPAENILKNESLYGIVSEIEHSAYAVQTPLQRLEHFWHKPVAFIIIPVFALVNAGIPIEWASISATLTNSITLGVSLGLLLGKFLGITFASWLAIQFKLGELPVATRFSQIAAVSVLGGIGFTMSIFIAELAFANAPEHLLMAKTGVLFASALAGIVGFSVLYYLGENVD